MKKEKIVILIELSVMFLIWFFNRALVEILIHNTKIQNLMDIMLFSESTFRILCSLITYMIIFILCIVLFRKNLSISKYSHKKNNRSIFLYIAIITSYFVCNIFSYYFLGKSIGNPFHSYFASILFFISIVCFGPVVEELFFRKILQSNLINQCHVPVKLAIVFQAILFFICHIRNNVLPVDVLLLGIIFGVIYQITQNILYTMIFHSSVNLSMFLFQVQILHVRHAMNIRLYVFIYSIFLMSIIFLVFLYVRMIKHDESIENKIT